MGIGSAIIGVAVGASAVLLVQKLQAEESPIIDIVEDTILDLAQETIDVRVDPIQIDSDEWQFEGTYFNRSNRSVRVEAKFEIHDPDNKKVVSQNKSITIEPSSEFKIFWNSGELTTVSNLVGDFTAVFTTEERGNFQPLSRPQVVIFPVALPGVP